MLGTQLLIATLYAPGPFFFYPWKALTNYLYGDTYDVAYRHFRRDHSNTTNLALHVVCLVFQLTTNMALLWTVDDTLGTPAWQVGPCTVRAVTAFTALSWLVVVATLPAPFLVTCASVASIAGAYAVAPAVAAAPAVVEAATVGVFVLVLVLGVGISTLGWGAGWIAFTGLWWWVAQSPYGGMYADNTQLIVIALIAWMLLMSQLKVPEAPAIGGTLVLRTAAALTGHPALLLWACAFVAPMLQGTAHKLTKQVATLINLNKSGAQTTTQVKVSFEWAHVTFFPSLAWHSVYQSLTGKSHQHTQ